MCTVFYIIHLGGLHVQKNRGKYDYGSIIMRSNYLPRFRCHPKEVTMHHHKPISDEEIQSLEKLGYNKHEIWKAAHIARISNKKYKMF